MRAADMIQHGPTWLILYYTFWYQNTTSGTIKTYVKPLSANIEIIDLEKHDIVF